LTEYYHEKIFIKTRALQNKDKEWRRIQKHQDIKNKINKLTAQPDFDTKIVYKLIKGNFKRKLITNFVSENKLIATKEEVISKIEKHWTNLFKKMPTGPIEDFLKNTPKVNKECKIIIKSEIIYQAIYSKKSNSAPSPDQLSYKILKLLAHSKKSQIIKVLKVIYKSIIVNETIPKKWKEGKIILIKKNNNDTSLNGWRPITLLNTCFKIFTGIVASEFIKINEKFNVILWNQHTSLPNRDTNTPIEILLMATQNRIKVNKEMHLLFIDYAQAFDRVNFETLIQIINHLNMGKLGNILIKALGGQSRLETAFGLTNLIEILSGVRQGDPLSPLLFAIYLIPLQWTIMKENLGIEYEDKSKVSHQFFMDDLVILEPDDQQLKILTKIIGKYSNITGSIINAKKSAYLTNKVTNRKEVTINKETIPFYEIGKLYKYLGIWINILLDTEDQMKLVNSAVMSKLATLKKKKILRYTLIDKINKHNYNPNNNVFN